MKNYQRNLKRYLTEENEISEKIKKNIRLVGISKNTICWCVENRDATYLFLKHIPISNFNQIHWEVATSDMPFDYNSGHWFPFQQFIFFEKIPDKNIKYVKGDLSNHTVMNVFKAYEHKEKDLFIYSINSYQRIKHFTRKYMKTDSDIPADRHGKEARSLQYTICKEIPAITRDPEDMVKPCLEFSNGKMLIYDYDYYDMSDDDYIRLSHDTFEHDAIAHHEQVDWDSFNPREPRTVLCLAKDYSDVCDEDPDGADGVIIDDYKFENDFIGAILIYNDKGLKTFMKKAKGIKKFSGMFSIENCQSIKDLSLFSDIFSKFTDKAAISIVNCKKLTSIEGCPEKVKFFEISDCPLLESLDGMPKEITDLFDSYRCPKLKNLNFKINAKKIYTDTKIHN